MKSGWLSAISSYRFRLASWRNSPSFVRGGVGALLVTADPYFDVQRDRIVAFAARRRLPAIYQFRECAVAGGILSYGLSFVDVYRQVGVYTAKILNGAKPAELPVQQVTKFELIINVKAAKTLGISISDNLLSLADEVIEWAGIAAMR